MGVPFQFSTNNDYYFDEERSMDPDILPTDPKVTEEKEIPGEVVKFSSSRSNGLVEQNEHGGSWLDSFDNSNGIESKNDFINISGSSAFFSPQTSSFNLTTTSDFDAGTKINVSTNTDNSTIPSGEIQITPKVVFAESFDGPDGINVTDYDSAWYLQNPTQGTAKLDQSEKYGGNASLKMKTKTSSGQGIYVEVYKYQNHSKVEFYMKFTNNGVGTAHFSLIRILRELTSGIIYNYGASGKQIRYYDGTTVYHTGSLNFNTWYKFTMEFNFATKRYNGWVDGGIYSNYLAANNCAFYDNIVNPWANVIWLNTGTAWNGVNVTTWYDNITLYGYSHQASWESNTIQFPPTMDLKEVNLTHYNLTSISKINKIQLLVGGILKAEYDVNITQGFKTVIQDSDLTWGSFKNIDNDFTIKINLSSNGARSPSITGISGIFEYNEDGIVISKPIIKTPNHYWDKLIIDKIVPPFGELNISILNNSNKSIPGFDNISGNNEIDISSLDSIKYPTIKLKGHFKGDYSIQPELKYWGICWNASNTWRDTFYGGPKIESSTVFDISDGIIKFQDTNNLTSTSITIPDKFYFNKLILNKTQIPGDYLNISVLDSKTNNPIPNYKNLTGKYIDLYGINTRLFNSIKLMTKFESSTGQLGNLSDWSVNWTENTKPEIVNISSVTTVNSRYYVAESVLDKFNLFN
jgi:hypothetical protein